MMEPKWITLMDGEVTGHMEETDTVDLCGIVAGMHLTVAVTSNTYANVCPIFIC